MGCVIIIIVMMGSALPANQVGLMRRLRRHLLLDPSALVVDIVS